MAVPRASALRFVAGCAAGLLAAPLSARSPGARAQSASPAAHPLPDEAWAVLYWANQARAVEDLPPLEPHPALLTAAQDYAWVLATTGCMAHECPPGDPLGELVGRVRQARYVEPVWCLGENLAAGYPDAEAVVTAWLGSPGHRENLLAATVRQFGAGVVRGGPGPWSSYWTLVVAGCRYG